MRTLVGLSFSPWTEKARWALRHHGLPYAYEEHVPLVGEAWVRWKLVSNLANARLGRQRHGRDGASIASEVVSVVTRRLTVPVLIDGDDGRSFGDALSIAKYAEAEGHGTPLFAPADADEDRSRGPAAGLRARSGDGEAPAEAVPFEAQVEAWNQRSEAALRACRSIIVHRMGDNGDARLEALPAGLPVALKPHLRPLADVGRAYMARKYQLEGASTYDNEAILRDALDALRAALASSASGPSLHLLGSFSYADIAMAVVLQGIKPVSDRFMPIGHALRDVWTHAELARAYADLLAWRDEIYEKHRLLA